MGALDLCGGAPRRRHRPRARAACLAVVIATALSLACMLPLRRSREPGLPVVDLSELVLTTEDLPNGWWRQGRPEPFTRHYPAADDAVCASFNTTGRAVAGHLVLRYRDAWEAAEQFRVLRSGEFRSWDDTVQPWELPADMGYASPIADEFVCACETRQDRHRIDGEFTICQALARYGPYVSEFFSHLSADRMTMADFERVLRRIDERMAAALYKATPSPEGTPAPTEATPAGATP